MSTETGSSTFEERMKERKRKLLELHKKRNEAGRLNHAEVVAEDKRAKEPKNAEMRKRKAEYLLEEEKRREICERSGKDFDREKLLTISADDAEATLKRKSKKMNPDEGFSGFEAATKRKYDNLVKGLKPDLTRYEADKADTAAVGAYKDSKAAVDRMAEDVKKQVEKRDKFSRRRMHDDDADIDYINERNMKFNKKLERFYGDYTKDIRDNLERGTAV